MKTIFAFVLFYGAGNLALALDLEGYLNQVKNQHKTIKSLEISKEVAEEKRQAGDISLVPVLQLKSSYLKDEKAPNSVGARESEATVYSVGFNKKFATGTQLGISANAGHMANPGLPAAQAAAIGDYTNGSLALSVSQSLWKDAFGKAVELRRERESIASDAEKMAAEIQAKILLIDAEKAFWDLIYQQQELKLRRASLDRAERIYKWVAKRLNDGINDRGDLLNAKALLSNRKFQLQTSEDDLKAAEQKIRSILNIEEAKAIPAITGDLNLNRTAQPYLKKMSVPNMKSGLTISFEAVTKSLESRINKVVEEEIKDSLKSDLVLSGSYASNPYFPNGSLGDVSTHLTDFGKPTTAVSLTWTYLFDSDSKSAQASQARKNAMSAQLQSEQLMIESDFQWKEYQRRYETLTQKIKTFEEISELQTERARVEQDKYSKGRSITQNVIMAEQDAAEAQLNLEKLKAEQRKMETQSHLFVSVVQVVQ
jgi:outer membrane protein TolC